ncbi:MAG: 50S ribosomal protein L29 [Proteobacteria bacterium]|nr:50S ribosomal protein L29 [Pseudomonadota bacterium]
MKFIELKDKAPKALVESLASIKKELFNLRMQKAEGKLEKTSRVRECRRDYARVKTKLTQIKSA